MFLLFAIKRTFYLITRQFKGSIIYVADVFNRHVKNMSYPHAFFYSENETRNDQKHRWKLLQMTLFVFKILCYDIFQLFFY